MEGDRPRVSGGVVQRDRGDGVAVTPAAFFDLDRTLMAGSSAYHFGRAMYKAGHMSRRQIARDAIDQIRFRVQGASDAAVNVLLVRVLEGIKGHRVVDLARMTPDVLAGILPRVYPQMLDVVRSHQDAGRPCFIATAASRAGRRDTRAGARDGRRVRHAVGDATTASTPAASTARSPTARARPRRCARSPPSAASTSSSRGPTPTRPPTCRCCEAVGHPVAVNPDAGLAEIARREGWEVLRFEKLGEPPAHRRRGAGRGRGRRQRQLARGAAPGARAAGPPAAPLALGHEHALHGEDGAAVGVGDRAVRPGVVDLHLSERPDRALAVAD